MIPRSAQKILDISEAQAETMVNPDGVADDFWREPMAIIARPATFHRTSLSVPAQIDNAFSHHLDALIKNIGLSEAADSPN
jgi:hypothetical protein